MTKPKRTITEADRQEALYTWLSPTQVARIYFADAEGGTAVSASTIIRWHDDENHPIKGKNWAPDGARKRLILFRPEDIERVIRERDAA